MESTLQVDALVKIISENVKARRLELGLTQTELADAVGVSQPFIAGLEAGNRVPRIDSIAKLADALRTTPDAILTPGIFSEATA